VPLAEGELFRFSGKIFQNLSVSSPDAVAAVEPSGEIAR